MRKKRGKMRKNGENHHSDPIYTNPIKNLLTKPSFPGTYAPEIIANLRFEEEAFMPYKHPVLTLYGYGKILTEGISLIF